MHKQRPGWLALAAFLFMNGLTTQSVAGECEELGGLGVGIGAVLVTLPTMVVTSFAAPGVAVLANDKLSYLPGVGWTALGTAVGAGAGSAAMLFDCPYPESLYAPALASLAGGVLGTTIWALVSGGAEDDDDDKGNEVDDGWARNSTLVIVPNVVGSVALMAVSRF